MNLTAKSWQYLETFSALNESDVTDCCVRVVVYAGNMLQPEFYHRLPDYSSVHNVMDEIIYPAIEKYNATACVFFDSESTASYVYLSFESVEDKTVWSLAR